MSSETTKANTEDSLASGKKNKVVDTIWNRPPISYFYAAIEDPQYLKKRNRYIVEQRIVWQERVKIVKEHREILIQKLEEEILKLKEKEQIENDEFYKKINEDYESWKKNTNN